MRATLFRHLWRRGCLFKTCPPLSLTSLSLLSTRTASPHPHKTNPSFSVRKTWGCHGDQATCLPWTSLNVLVTENKPKCTDFKLLVVSPWPTQSLCLIPESTGGAPKLQGLGQDREEWGWESVPPPQPGEHLPVSGLITLLPFPICPAFQLL